MIIFLDIDGVLHPEPCYDEAKLFFCLPRLEHVLREFKLIKIVISSTWRETRSLSDLRKYFSADIAERILGVTPNWREVPELIEISGYQHHAEIEGRLRQSGSPWQSWVAIDDKPYLFKPFLKNLVKKNLSAAFDALAEEVLR